MGWTVKTKWWIKKDNDDAVQIRLLCTCSRNIGEMVKAVHALCQPATPCGFAPERMIWYFLQKTFALCYEAHHGVSHIHASHDYKDVGWLIGIQESKPKNISSYMTNKFPDCCCPSSLTWTFVPFHIISLQVLMII